MAHWALKAIGALAFVWTTVAPASAQQGPLPVDVAKPLTARIVDWDEFTGRFEAVRRVEIRARVSGYLDEVLFADGELVRRGDTLFVIDPRPFQLALDRAEAQLQAAVAEQTRATTDLTRGRELVGTRALSESVLDERQAAKLRADADVSIAEAALSEAALDLEFAEVTAPIAGRISARRVDPGNLVGAGDTLLATIVSIDPIHLVFTASEADFLKYARLGATGERPTSRNEANPVEARLLDETGWPHRGAMNFVDNEIDPNAGTITGRAIFDNPTGVLTPGLFARLRLIASGEYDAILLPDDAIVSDQARKLVMTVGEDGVVAAKVVEPGELYRGMRVIRSGVSAEDVVIVSGVQRARPGGAVIPQETVLEFSEAPTSN